MLERNSLPSANQHRFTKKKFLREKWSQFWNKVISLVIKSDAGDTVYQGFSTVLGKAAAFLRVKDGEAWCGWRRGLTGSCRLPSPGLLINGPVKLQGRGGSVSARLDLRRRSHGGAPSSPLLTQPLLQSWRADTRSRGQEQRGENKPSWMNWGALSTMSQGTARTVGRVRGCRPAKGSRWGNFTVEALWLRRVPFILPALLQMSHVHNKWLKWDRDFWPLTWSSSDDLLTDFEWGNGYQSC